MTSPEKTSSGIISKSDYRRATWKNGLGYTDEIAIFPEGSDLRRGDFLWRLSSARIENSSAFSTFPAHDRTLVILKGAGVRLIHTFDGEGEEDQVDVPLLSPYEFPGDVPSRCELISGPITDLSIFIRKAEVEATTEMIEVEVGETHDWVPCARWNFAFAAKGNFEVVTTPNHPARPLPEGDTFRIDLHAPLPENQPIRIQASQTVGKLVIIGLS